MSSSSYRAICASSGPTRPEKEISAVPYIKLSKYPYPTLPPDPCSCTVFLNSKIEPRLSGFVLFVWVFRIANGLSKQPIAVCYQDLGVRMYGPLDDRGYLEFKRSELEEDAYKFFSRTESVPSLIRARTHLNPRITYRMERV